MFSTDFEIDFGRRNPDPGVSSQFYKRWSPRSFRKVQISDDIQRSIFDAARWSPSCFNEQPWLIVTTESKKDFDLFLEILVEKNRQWAVNAGILGFIFGRRNFSYNDKPNRWSSFDCGAAWMSIALEARSKDLYAHAMAGYSADMAYRRLEINREIFRVICAFAIGAIDSPAKLAAEFRSDEIPSGRKTLGEIWKRSPGEVD